MKRIVAFILALLGYGSAHAAEPIAFVWRPVDIVAEIRADNSLLKIGKYLYLEHRIDEGEIAWTMSKFDIPNAWHVDRLGFEGNDLVIQVRGIGSFFINSKNFGELSFAILDGGLHKTDEVLEEIWKQYAWLHG